MTVEQKGRQFGLSARNGHQNEWHIFLGPNRLALDPQFSGQSTQNFTVGSGSLVANLAWGKNSTAYQNLASNDSCEPPAPICRGAECGPFASN